MFTIAQQIIKMETINKSLSYIMFVLMALIIVSCSSTSNLPIDDAYYSSKSNNPTQYNWDDFQERAQNHGNDSDNSGTISQPEETGAYVSEYSEGAGTALGQNS